jgi:hypothetical protein
MGRSSSRSVGGNSCRFSISFKTCRNTVLSALSQHTRGFLSTWWMVLRVSLRVEGGDIGCFPPQLVRDWPNMELRKVGIIRGRKWSLLGRVLRIKTETVLLVATSVFERWICALWSFRMYSIHITLSTVLHNTQLIQPYWYYIYILSIIYILSQFSLQSSVLLDRLWYFWNNNRKSIF